MDSSVFHCAIVYCIMQECAFQGHDVTIAAHIKEVVSSMCGSLSVENNTSIVHSPQIDCSNGHDVESLMCASEMASSETFGAGCSPCDGDAFEWCKFLSEWNVQRVKKSNWKSDESTSKSSPFKGTQTAYGRQHKGGSKSSTSSSSSHQSGSGSGSRHRQDTAGGRSGRGRGSGRGYSSGSTDSSEDDKDDDDKRRRPYHKRNKEPKSKPGFSDDEDDEATDSADEGVNQDTPNSITLDFSPQSQNNENRGHPTGGTKERYRSDLPNSLPGLGGKSVRGSDGLVSTISVESIISSKDSGRVAGSIIPVPQSPINMAVGYGIPSAAAAPPQVLDNMMDTQPSQQPVENKSPQESSTDLTLGTPTLDSPRPLGNKELNSPGTPPPMSPEIAPSFPVEVRYTCTCYNNCC